MLHFKCKINMYIYMFISHLRSIEQMSRQDIKSADKVPRVPELV